MASGEQFPGVSASGQSTGLPRKPPGNLPVSAAVGEAESTTRMETGGEGATGFEWSPAALSTVASVAGDLCQDHAGACPAPGTLSNPRARVRAE